MNLTPGGNAPVPAQELRVRVTSGGAVDASAFRLYASGKVQGDADMFFYGQPRNDDGSISLASEGQYSTFTVALRIYPKRDFGLYLIDSHAGVETLISGGFGHQGLLFSYRFLRLLR